MLLTYCTATYTLSGIARMPGTSSELGCTSPTVSSLMRGQANRALDKREYLVIIRDNSP